MRQGLRLRQGLGATPQGLVRIAETPQGHGQRPQTAQPGVGLVEQVVGIVLLRVVDGEPVLQVRARRGELAQPQQGIPQDVVATQEERRIALPFGQHQELLPEITGAP